MRSFIIIIGKLKFLGLLGLPSLFSDAAIWKYLWLFWLFGLLEISLTFRSFTQSLRQMAGLIYITFKYDPAPDKDNYSPKVHHSLPFEDQWVIVNGGVVKEISHSWDVTPQRYAYDFIALDENGKSHSGSGASVSDYYCYGRSILAPANGVVIETANHFKDSEVIGNGQTDPLIQDIRGNYIVMQHAEDEFSILAHLKPGSVLVSAGQAVKRKEPVALCGNFGNTSEPHLHFQVQNGNSFYSSAGLPIHFQDIEAASCDNYFVYDKRPEVVEAGASNTFISRGQSVRNIC